MSEADIDQITDSKDLRNKLREISVVHLSNTHVHKLKLLQRRVLISLISGYSGYYFLRTDLTVALNRLLQSLSNIDKSQFGVVLSVSYVVYALGKFTNGSLADQIGGTKVFMGGLFGSMLASILMIVIPTKASYLYIYGILWSLNRYFQSAGWGALVKVLSGWYPSEMHGRILGIATISYGLGDVFVRIVLGGSLAALEKNSSNDSAFIWHWIFGVSVMSAALLSVPGLFWLRSSPAYSGLKLQDELIDFKAEKIASERTRDALNHASSHTLGRIADSENDANQGSGMLKTIRHLISKPKFWTLVILAPCLTLIRETFYSWAPVFLINSTRMSDSSSAVVSLFFPLFGTLSTVTGGWLMDRLCRRNQGKVPVIWLFGLTLTLLVFSLFEQLSIWLAVLLMSSSAFFLMAPYSFVEGLFVVSLTGSKNPATAVGIINCIGYIGAVLAGHQMGYLAEYAGWPQVFLVLSGVSLLSLLVSIIYMILDWKEIGLIRMPARKMLDKVHPIQVS